MAPRPSPFQDLERQARRLQRVFVTLVTTVALLPSLVFVVLEIGHLRMHARDDGRQLAMVFMAEVRQSGFDLPVLTARMTREMHGLHVVSVRLVGPGGRESFRAGEPVRRIFPTEVTLPWPPGAAWLGELHVQADERPLFRRIARVFLIHFLVAAVLAVVVYCLPSRALNRAIVQAEGTYAQLVHAEKLSALGTIYAGLSHEINNPLGIIVTRSKALLALARNGGVTPELVPELELIDRQANRIAGLVRGLLTFSRRATLERRDIDLNAVLTEVVTLVRSPFAKLGIQVNCVFDPALPRLSASPDHLQQVFVNLLNNARDAMPGGGTIELTTSRREDQVVAEVRDSGTGIAPDVRARIFEPFFTTKDPDKGTGLGLSLSYGIVTAHGGDLDVQSEPGRGAIFRVALPLRGGSR